MNVVQRHLAKLPENWQELFLAMYDQGCSDHEVMREYGITPKAWKLMYDALGESEFREVVDFGHALAQAWWEAQGRNSLNKRGFNVRLYDINMQNRYGWAKKAEVNESDGQAVGADDKALDERIAQLRKEISGGAETE